MIKLVSEVLLSSHWAAPGDHKNPTKTGRRLFHWCPGCEEIHGVEVDPANSPVWTWNGDFTKPTYSPSVLHFTTDPDGSNRRTLCHYFIKDGNIEFCGDCPHALAGTIVPLPSIPNEWRR